MPAETTSAEPGALVHDLGTGCEVEDETAGEDESVLPESELAEELEEPWDSRQEAGQSAPPVNLLANLLRWVASAKKQLGSEQLPLFLEVYGLTGCLSPELKEIILHLADIAVLQPTGNKTELWGQLILELHGILAGDPASLRQFRLSWNGTSPDAKSPPTEDADKAKHKKPPALKLVLDARPEILNHNVETVPRLFKQIQRALEEIPEEIVLEEISLEDGPVYRMLAQGYTIACFQLETPVIRKMCRDLRVDQFEDLVAVEVLEDVHKLDH
jgi:hypothetical protein